MYTPVEIRHRIIHRVEQVGYYRFLGNENVTVSELAPSVADRRQQQVEGLHVLSISDVWRPEAFGGVTHIGDRESDLYEEWATVPDAQTYLLVRARQNRRLLRQSTLLYSRPK